MRFINPKEEVLKIKLTQHGHYLISQGRFDPVYYCFFDDDIIYDSSYLSGTGDTTELQNSIENRILNDTPRFEGQTSFEGADVWVQIANPNFLDDLYPGISNAMTEIPIQIGKWTSQYILQNPLARCAYNTDGVPFYSLHMLTGSIKSVETVGIEGSGYSGTGIDLKKDTPTAFIDIVKVDLISTININTFPSAVAPSTDIQDDELFDAFYVFKDGTSITYDKKRIFIKLEEGNTEFLKENFDIEIFEITETQAADGEIQIDLEKYYFTEKNKTPEKTNVEYFFNIKLDNDIEESYYCEAIKNNPNKIKDIFSDNTFTCSDKTEKLINVNIYNTDKLQGPDEGDC